MYAYTVHFGKFVVTCRQTVRLQHIVCLSGAVRDNCARAKIQFTSRAKRTSTRDAPSHIQHTLHAPMIYGSPTTMTVYVHEPREFRLAGRRNFQVNLERRNFDTYHNTTYTVRETERETRHANTKLHTYAC